jgi:hypothetical protein
MSTPVENTPEAPYRFSKERRRLSEGDSLSDEDDINEEAKEEDEEDIEISNLNEKMQGMQQTTIQRNIFLRETFA